ncbi:hypothetical protein [Hymenobacter latericus]|uniref:hypothetical protein n=1 Tax=Hymenobacter sp. YIM 151858-1 TaxID=2987688 RepID=UPI002225F458|nr:hypothetical protein [Hymenobacter sp. YIM 151858-1]UYZ60777.1 hypothetical protein OIS50_08230 [Hymenobacter sp. YIM 151858-1]
MALVIELPAYGQAKPQPRPLLVNGKPLDMKQCVPLATFKTITLPPALTDSARVSVFIATGSMCWGGKAFRSVKDFNAFDLKAWLSEERNAKGPSFSCALDANGNSMNKKKAVDGTRIILTVSGASEEFYVYRFCTEEELKKK